MEEVVDRPEDLTPPWLSEAFRVSGRHLEVVDVSFEPVGTGQMGTTYRLNLTYRGPDGPATLIAKMAGEDEALRVLVAPGYAAEVGFYTKLAAGLDVRTPRCWYGAISADNTRFILLLDDASPARPGIQTAGCTVEQASASLRNLVGLHAPKWSDPKLRDMEFLPRPNQDSADTTARVMSSATEAFVTRYASELGEDSQTLRDTSAVIAKWQLAGPEPFSVIHGDYRLDNLLFDPVTDQVTAVDWQTAAIGPPLRDVAYFLGTSLPSEARRAHEEELVAEYHATLLERGIRADYTTDQCWNDYRLGQLQGPMITVIGCIYASAATRTEASDAMFLAMARRSCAAVRELGSLDLV